MALTFTIDGVDYTLDGDPEIEFTGRELGIIKRVAGVSFGQIGDALANGDSDVIIALAYIAQRRVEPAASVDDLLDRPFSDINVRDDDPEDEDDPPAKPAPKTRKKGAGSKGGSTGGPTSSGSTA